MRQALHITLVIVMVALTAGCTGSPKNDKGTGSGHAIRPSDTLHTKQVAMNIYGYQPIRALQIIDSAIIVGNISEPQASLCRARIYSMSLMHEQVDSLLGGPTDVRLDSAQAEDRPRRHQHTLRRTTLPVHRQCHHPRTPLYQPQLRARDDHGAFLSVEGARGCRLLQGQQARQDEHLYPTTASGACRPTALGTTREEHRADSRRNWFHQQRLLQQPFPPAIRHVSIRLSS